MSILCSWFGKVATKGLAMISHSVWSESSSEDLELLFCLSGSLGYLVPLALFFDFKYGCRCTSWCCLSLKIQSNSEEVWLFLSVQWPFDVTGTRFVEEGKSRKSMFRSKTRKSPSSSSNLTKLLTCQNAQDKQKLSWKKYPEFRVVLNRRSGDLRNQTKANHRKQKAK